MRFSLEYLEASNKLHATIIDAWDLPPMDKNGKSDPYVEVSVRPGKEKFTTQVKHNSLNPTFNETAILPLSPNDIDEGEIVIKVLDSDFPLQDELIGIIRLPLNALDLAPSPKHHTCLILHEKGKNNRNAMSSLDAAKLNLKISHQTQELLDLQAQLRTVHENLEEVREESKKMRTRKVDLEINNLRLKTELDALSRLPQSVLDGASDDGGDENSSSGKLTLSTSQDIVGSCLGQDISKANSNSSSSISIPSAVRKSSRKSEKADRNLEVDHTKCDELKKHLDDCIKNREDEVEELKKKVQTLKPIILDETRNGQIDVGLAFLADSEIFRIKILSGSKIRAVDGDSSDPYCKIKVFHQGKKMKSFETTVKWKNLSPEWNDDFQIKDITSNELISMYVEIVVLDKNKVRQDQPIGQFRIGPNHGYVDQHWEEMLKTPGQLVVKTHAIRDM